MIDVAVGLLCEHLRSAAGTRASAIYPRRLISHVEERMKKCHFYEFILYAIISIHAILSPPMTKCGYAMNFTSFRR